MRDNLERVLERDEKLSDLDSRAGEDTTTGFWCASILCHFPILRKETTTKQLFVKQKSYI